MEYLTNSNLLINSDIVGPQRCRSYKHSFALKNGIMENLDWNLDLEL